MKIFHFSSLHAFKIFLPTCSYNTTGILIFLSCIFIGHYIFVWNTRVLVSYHSNWEEQFCLWNFWSRLKNPVAHCVDKTYIFTCHLYFHKRINHTDFTVLTLILDKLCHKFTSNQTYFPITDLSIKTCQA